MKDRNSYSTILKSIGLFGGVKVFQILVGIVRNKIVAVLLGPAGMGISGMITSTTNLVNSVTGLGLHTSTVRDIAIAHESKNEDRIGAVIKVLRTLVFFTGLIGTIITFLLAPILSRMSFGNEDYTQAFRIVSVILLFNQLTVGQTALMQGTFHYKYMAKSSLMGSIIGLIVTVPLYYFFGVKAIVPVIILSSLTALLLATFYSNKIKYKKVTLTVSQIISLGRTMILLGLSVALTSVLGTGQVYIIRSFISKHGSISDVGLYVAGISIATQYVDVILQSMGTDYAPRLSALSGDIPKFNEAINRQLKLLITIITPLIIPFIVFIRQLTILLYSDKFIAITGMIEWIMLGMFFRTVSWCMSYSLVARGESKLFLINDSIATLYTLVLYILGYKLASFTGLGVAFCVGYIFYIIQYYFMCKKIFNFSYSRDAVKTLLLFLFLLLGCFVILGIIGHSPVRYYLGALMSLCGGAIGYWQLNKMMPIKESFKNLLKKRKS